MNGISCRENINIEIKMRHAEKEKGLLQVYEDLGLTSVVSTNNMHLLNAEDFVQKYYTP